MGAIANKTHTVASDVTNGSTFTTAYPAGTSQASLRGTTNGQLTYGGVTYVQDAASGIVLTFGASSITVKNNTGITLPAGAVLNLSFGNTSPGGSYNLTVGGAHEQAAAGDGSGAVIQALTASGAVAAATDILELNHASVVIAATMDVSQHQGLFIVRNTSASGTAAHTLTLTNGTWDGTTTIATMAAPGRSVVVFFDSTGRGQIINNNSAVLS